MLLYTIIKLNVICMFIIINFKYKYTYYILNIAIISLLQKNFFFVLFRVLDVSYSKNKKDELMILFPRTFDKYLHKSRRTWETFRGCKRLQLDDVGSTRREIKEQKEEG